MKRHIALILFFLVVIVGCILAPSIGPAWDEPDNMFSGGVYVNFFSHGASPKIFENLTGTASVYGDRIFANDHVPSHLPPVHNFVGVLFVQAASLFYKPVTSVTIIIAWHIVTVLFFALMVTMTYRFGVLLGLSTPASVFAALAVFMYPQLFGHGLSNSKDTAQAALVITSLYYLVRGKRYDLVRGSVMWGLGLATKFNAVYIPIIWGIWNLREFRVVGVIRALKQVGFVLVIGLATMFLVWPYLWHDTYSHVLEVVKYFTTVGQGYRVMWNGTWYLVGAGKSLWWYPVLSFLYTTPIPLLLLWVFGVVRVFWEKDHKRKLLFIWILVPLLRILWPWSAFYDLLRHFLEILPAVMLVAATGLDWFFKKKQHLKMTGVMLGMIIVGQMVYINATLFPYSTGYYNMFARNQNENFDRDIEALSVKEAMEFVHTTYGNVRVFLPIGGHLSWHYLTRQDQYVFPELGRADIVIVVNKTSHQRIADYQAQHLIGYSLVHEIRRGEAIFAWIFKKD